MSAGQPRDISSPREAIVSASRNYRIEGKRKRETAPLITKILAALSTRIYETGNTIEQTVGKLKRFTCIARRCEKTARNYASFVALALGFILIKSVV
jgi:hypothetical protein